MYEFLVGNFLFYGVNYFVYYCFVLDLIKFDEVFGILIVIEGKVVLNVLFYVVWLFYFGGNGIIIVSDVDWDELYLN